MTMVIARDATASDHLVYAWPFPLGPEEIEVTCGEDEIVVMCPSWLVGDRLGPGRHRWRTPDPSRPVGAYFVSMAPVECSFDVTTSFVIPSTQQTATLRAQGSIIVRCVDPGLLIAQFVGLPFDNVNDGLIRSVTRSSERLIARVLTRRTVMAQTVVAVTDPGMTASIVDELVAYNPVAGAVFGVEFVRMTGLYVTTGDAQWATGQLDVNPADWASHGSQPGVPSLDAQGSAPRYIPTEPTKQGVGASGPSVPKKPDPMQSGGIVSGEIGMSSARQTGPTPPTGPMREDITTPGMVPVGAGPPLPSKPGLVPPPPSSTAAGSVPPVSVVAPAPPAPAAPSGPIRDGEIVAGSISSRGTSDTGLRSTMKGHAVPAPETKRPSSNPGIAPPPAASTSSPRTGPGPDGPTPVSSYGGSGSAVAGRGPAAVTQPPPVGGIKGEPPPPSNPTITPPPAAGTPGSGPVPRPAITPPAAASAAMSRSKTPSVPPPMPVPSSTGLTPSLAAMLPRPKSATQPGPGLGDGKKSDGVPEAVAHPGMGMGGIGMGRIGESPGAGSPSASITSEDEKSVKGEIVEKLETGARVLVPGADGRLVAATIRQEQSGYYELEIGGTGETLWVPRANVVEEK
jgi:hypothetical protein